MIFWLSFADVHRPPGSQFLGVAIVSTPGDFLSAVKKAHQLRINPGGEVQGFQLPPWVEPSIREYMDRLLTRKEAEAADIVMGEANEKLARKNQA